MNVLPWKEHKWQEHISLLCMVLICFSLPFSVKICSICIIALAVHWILIGRFKEKWQIFSTNKFIWIFCGFYLLHVIWMINTANTKMGLFDLEKKLSLFLFPLILSTTKLPEKGQDKVLLSFVLACLAGCLICFFKSYLAFEKTGDPVHFSAGFLAKGIDIHRVYFSLYLLFCCMILMKGIFNDQYSKTFKLLLGLVMGFFVVFIYLLAARISFFYIGIVFIPAIVIILIRKKQYLLTGAILLFLVASFFTVLIFSSSTRILLRETFVDLDKGNVSGNTTGPNLRVLIWKYSFEVMKQTFPVGAGTGDVDDLLLREYTKNNFALGMEQKFNAHNQFLQTTIGIGMIGIVSLILAFTFPFFYSSSKDVWLYAGFISAFAFFCLTESMLCTQKGVVFYAFFNSFLLFQNKGNR